MALSAMALATGCSNDEVTAVSDSNAIKFSATTGNITRGAVTTTNSIESFKTYAYLNDDNKTTFMDGVTVSKSDDTWSTPSIYFWPSTALNFYSVSPASNTITKSGDNYTISNFTVNETVGSQEDLLYAVNAAVSKDTKSGTVEVNFRHALSQIVFQASNTNDALKVVINGVKIANVLEKGTFTYPTATTTSTTLETVKGTWETVSGTKTFAAGIKETTMDGKTESAQSLMNEDGTGALLLIPQTLTAGTVNTTSPYISNAHFLVSCKIYNKTSNTLLWPATDAYAEVAVPLAETTWAQGTKYTYTFIFGEGGGYNPDDGKPVLVPIKYTVTVDEFTEAEATDATMTTTE